MKSRIGIAAAVGLASVGVVAAPASAAEVVHCLSLKVQNTYLADGCFASAGDWIQVADMKDDGLRAVVEWETNYGREDECHDANGAGSDYVNCNYDMREAGYIKFRVVVRNGANGANQASTTWTEWIPIDGD